MSVKVRFDAHKNKKVRFIFEPDIFYYSPN
jgi:hypothetical protein